MSPPFNPTTADAVSSGTSPDAQSPAPLSGAPLSAAERGAERSAEDNHATAAFESAMLMHLEDVMRYARSLTKDAADADDLVQETYLRAFKAWHTFDMNSDPRRWLFAICRHAFLRTRQREAKHVSIEDEPAIEALAAVAQHKAAKADGLDSLFARIDLGPAVARALAALSDAHRMVVVMVDIEGQGYDEVARELGVPIGTVRSRLFRARRQLQQALIAHAHDAGLASHASTEKESTP